VGLGPVGDVRRGRGGTSTSTNTGTSGPVNPLGCEASVFDPDGVLDAARVEVTRDR
jgi:hypothetical protein